MPTRRRGPRGGARWWVTPLVAAQLVAVPSPAASPGDDVVLVGAGDIASCRSNDDESTAALVDQVVAAHPGATVFTIGDNVYNSGTADEFSRCYAPTWGRHKARTRPAPENHDYRTSGASGYFDYFGPAAGEPGTGWYEYRAGAWQVIVLNSACASVGGCGTGSPQEQWLRAVLAASTASCTLAIWDHPVFSSSSHHGSHAVLRPFWQALYEFGADVVLAGHDHVYERFAPQTATGTADGEFGIRQFTVGTGGKSHYGFGSALPNSEVRNRDTVGVLQLTLRAEAYDWQFLPEAGRTFTDAGTGSCHGRPPPASQPARLH